MAPSFQRIKLTRQTPASSIRFMTRSLLVASIVLVLGVLALIRGQRLSRRAAVRDGLARFRTAVGGRYPETLVEAVFGYLSDRHGATAPTTVVKPTDDLATVHGLADLDLEDAALVITDRAAVRIPTVADLEEMKQTVRTVADLLEFLEPYFLPSVVRE